MNIKRNILLNPGPATTTNSVKKAMLVPDICPREEDFGAVLSGISNDLPKVVHGENDYAAVLFTASGTGGLEAVVTSAIPDKGKLLVIQNGAYGKRIINIAETYKIDTVKYSIETGTYPDLEKIEMILKNDPQITQLAIVHHETTTGMLNPVEAICELAHRNNVEVMVDAMSSFAGIPINIKKWNADYLISSSNKCIQGMPGLVFVIFKKAILSKIERNRRSYYFDIHAQYTGFNNTGQMPFTPPVQVVYALRQALDEYFTETEAGRWERYTTNWDILYNGLKKLGFKFLLEESYQSRILLAVIEPIDENYSFQKMHDYLYTRGFTIYPGKGAKESTFRLAIIGDLHAEDINAFLNTLQMYISENNITIV